MSIKIHGGTPRSNPSLCKSCTYAHIIKGQNLQEIIMCHQTDPNARITFPVSECNKYQNASQPTRYDMEEIAWIVKSRNRGPMGFTEGKHDVIVTIEPPKRDREVE